MHIDMHIDMHVDMHVDILPYRQFSAKQNDDKA